MSMDAETKYQYRSHSHEILEAMDVFGGSFVRQLATLYRLADTGNRRKLESTFRNYFQQYDEMVLMKAQREANGR